MKVVYFITGDPAQAAADLRRLAEDRADTVLRVVIPHKLLRAIQEQVALASQQVLSYRPLIAPWLWLCLLRFLGLTQPVEIICQSSRRQYRLLKLLALMLRGRLSFSLGDGHYVHCTLGRLCLIRLRQWLDSRQEPFRTLPVGVIGSASGFYMKKIVLRLRARFPEAKLHGLLLPSLAGSAGSLFDSVTILQPGFTGVLREAWKLWHVRRRFRAWIILCTNEPYRREKLLAFLLPLPRRFIYNELGDGFAARQVRMLLRHVHWRLRDQLWFQAMDGSVGRRGLRLIHPPLYAMRLLAGLLLLLRFRWKSGDLFRVHNQTGTSVQGKPHVDLFVLGAEECDCALQRKWGMEWSYGKVGWLPDCADKKQVQRWVEAVRCSEAEFLCLLDADCSLPSTDWLGHLLEAFDERTAQVAPQIVSPDGQCFLQGLLLREDGLPLGNLDNVVRWCRHPEWLEVDALPWICVVIRRKAIADLEFSAAECDSVQEWGLALRLARRLAAQGWRSVCLRNVSVIHPAAAIANETKPLLQSEGAFRETS
ncbi:MAG: hypothetical protein HY647_11030 [Acidobacteria bacterium]|nr:hypothetical protein [Acidobacteriota bacterium]